MVLVAGITSQNICVIMEISHQKPDIIQGMLIIFLKIIVANVAKVIYHFIRPQVQFQIHVLMIK